MAYDLQIADRIAGGVATRFLKYLPPGYNRQDLIHEVMVELLKRKNQFNAKRSSYYTFVFMISRSVIKRSSLRWNKFERRCGLPVPLEDINEISAATKLQDRPILLSQLKTAIDRLPTLPRQVIKKSVYNGEDHRSISAELGISRSQVSKIKAQGIDRLQAIMTSNRSAPWQRKSNIRPA